MALASISYHLLTTTNDPKGATPSPSSWFYFDIYMATSSKGGALEQYLGLAPLQVAEGSEAGLTQANLNISA